MRQNHLRDDTLEVLEQTPPLASQPAATPDTAV
jgi:hypothetical protein